MNVSISHLGYMILELLNVQTDVREDPFAWIDEDLNSVIKAVHRIGVDHAQYWPLSFTPLNER